ncbi:DNA recombination protein RmuC [Methylocella sp. CPCC 101449]|uniref:DNA recombination protein RmuC n=1 Tax=Methylocella sp. CPCC 101449 TaxID=2987531 RepID=UPI002891B32A|nr:DNA recombination protein RmuC [Methylocella sp. CPCC 101449]MDT2019229.1 DNA recombination protein RmuC [Methylocella sp. CPCC 101449]
MAFCALVLFIMAIGLIRAGGARRLEAELAAERQREIDDKMAALSQINAELSGRLRGMGDALTSRQGELARLLTDRLDAVGHRVGQGLESSGRFTADQLTKLSERLAVIDKAQEKLTGMTQEVVSLKDILANKQSRGAFGQGRMEAIVRDGLHASAYEFQATLSNGSRPDCLIRLPGDERAMAVDAKFPLEAFTALKDATNDMEREHAGRRVRTDLAKHIKDIADKYLLSGETQDLALLFVPSESIYADLNSHFDDVIQRAHRARVIIVSPSLLMMAIQVMQSLVRDRRMQEQTHLIQREVRSLLDDLRRLGDRVAKLDAHFRQAQEDVAQITTSTEKLVRRGSRIDQLELDPQSAPQSTPSAAPSLRNAAE